MSFIFQVECWKRFDLSEQNIKSVKSKCSCSVENIPVGKKTLRLVYSDFVLPNKPNLIVLTELKKGLKFLRELNFFEHFQSRMHICLLAHCQNQRESGHGHDS